MCGRFTQERPTSDLAEIFEAQDLADDPGAHFNVAPTDEAVVVARRRDEQTALVRYRWGLIPHWADSARVGSRMFNARSETVAASPVFREAFRRRRCLVPVDSFYEWRREGKVRQPFRVAAANGRPLALAGLWAGWRNPETEQVVRTFTIITGGPNEAMAQIHDRMPVVVPESAWALWLDNEGTDPAELQGLFVPAPDETISIRAVRPLVNDVRNDGPELIVPLGA